MAARLSSCGGALGVLGDKARIGCPVPVAASAQESPSCSIYSEATFQNPWWQLGRFLSFASSELLSSRGGPFSYVSGTSLSEHTESNEEVVGTSSTPASLVFERVKSVHLVLVYQVQSVFLDIFCSSQKNKYAL